MAFNFKKSVTFRLAQAAKAAQKQGSSGQATSWADSQADLFGKLQEGTESKKAAEAGDTGEELDEGASGDDEEVN